MSAQGQQVDVTSLDLPQLAEVKKQLETEIQHLTSSFGQLKGAQAKFRSCIECVDSIKPENAGKTTLVPLTSSLYVPGKLADVDNVIVDIGTGYYVEKSTADAKKLYAQKIEFVTKNLEQLQETILRKQDNMQAVTEIMRAKLIQQQQQQQPDAAAAAAAA
ncbi:subunit of tubulin prefoldin [Thecaphora frezii]